MASIASKGLTWSKLAELLGDRALRARVSLAVNDPAAYVTKHARELAERGITKPIGTLPLFALLDGLGVTKRVALIDWKSPADEVRDALQSIRPRVKVNWAWTKAFEEDELDDLTTERILQAAAANAPPGIVLMNLDTGSDQFAIVFAPSARATQILAAMKAVGHRAEAIAPKAVAAPKLPTSVPRGGKPMESWPSCKDDPFNGWRYFMNRKTLRSLFLIKYATAFDVMLGPSWSTNTKNEKRTFASAARCTAAYVAYYDALPRDGWLQFTAEEHAKEVRANAAAKKRGALRRH